jgi:hypothetical protein
MARKGSDFSAALKRVTTPKRTPYDSGPVGIVGYFVLLKGLIHNYHFHVLTRSTKLSALY